MYRSLTLAAVLVLGCAEQNTAPPPIAPTEPAVQEPVTSFSPPPKTQYSPGLEVVDTKVGTGAECKAGDRITVRYVGTLDDGAEFDKNASATFQIGVGMLIKGWDEGIPGMKVGGVRKLTVPPSLGYGSKAKTGIPAYSTLHFEVELLAVNP